MTGRNFYYTYLCFWALLFWEKMLFQKRLSGHNHDRSLYDFDPVIGNHVCLDKRLVCLKNVSLIFCQNKRFYVVYLFLKEYDMTMVFCIHRIRP